MTGSFGQRRLWLGAAGIIAGARSRVATGLYRWGYMTAEQRRVGGGDFHHTHWPGLDTGVVTGEAIGSDSGSSVGVKDLFFLYFNGFHCGYRSGFSGCL